MKKFLAALFCCKFAKAKTDQRSVPGSVSPSAFAMVNRPTGSNDNNEELSASGSPAPSTTNAVYSSSASQSSSGHPLTRQARADVIAFNERLSRENGRLFARDPTVKLHPLKNPRNGKRIVWFPDTLPELRDMGIHSINQLICFIWDDFDLRVDHQVKIEYIARAWVQLDDQRA